MYRMLNIPGFVSRISDNAIIPSDSMNSDYQKYLAWVALGNITEPYVPTPTPVPSTVTMRQARLALLQAGKLAEVGTVIAGLPSPQKEAAQIEWEYSAEVQRDRALVQMLAPALNLSEQDLDNLFILAASL